MKERPILFSGEMVRAILEGRKTQTRRIPNRQPLDWCTRFEPAPFEGAGKPGKWLQMTEDAFSIRGWCKCAYGQPGDRLWVRETWAHDDMNCKDVHCGNIDHVWYRALENPIVADSFAGDAHWRPSIFMPRWASWITLEIVNIRVERLQEISESNAEAEGVDFIPSAPAALDHRTAFAGLWNKINAKRGYSWESNPWVWAIEFKRVEI